MSVMQCTLYQGLILLCSKFTYYSFQQFQKKLPSSHAVPIIVILLFLVAGIKTKKKAKAECLTLLN